MKQAAIISMILLVPTWMEAGECQADTDCKGNRVCYKGSCMSESVAAKYEQEDFEKSQAAPSSQTGATETAPTPSGQATAVGQASQPGSSGADAPNQAPQGVIVGQTTQLSATPDPREDFERVKTALPDFSHEKDFLVYGRLLKAGYVQGSFIDYKLYVVKKRKGRGIAMVTLGSIFAVSGISMTIAGAAVATRDNDGFWFASVGAPGLVQLFCIGVPLLATGAVRLLRSKRMLAGLKSLETDSTQTSTSGIRFGFAPLFARTTATTLGLSGYLSF